MITKLEKAALAGKKEVIRMIQYTTVKKDVEAL